jgi:hypothetical protein
METVVAFFIERLVLSLLDILIATFLPLLAVSWVEVRQGRIRMTRHRLAPSSERSPHSEAGC